MSKLLQEIDRLITEWREGGAPAGATESAISDLLLADDSDEADLQRPSGEAIYQKPLG